MAAEVHKQLYGRWLFELWHGELAVAHQICAPSFVGHWPQAPAKVRGPHALAEIVRETRSHFDGLEFTVDLGPVAEGDVIAARWTGRGTFQGDEVSLRGHDFLRVEGGRIAEYWVIAEQPG